MNYPLPTKKHPTIENNNQIYNQGNWKPKRINMSLRADLKMETDGANQMWRGGLF